VVRLLLHHGADPWATTSLGETAEDIAIARSREKEFFIDNLLVRVHHVD